MGTVQYELAENVLSAEDFIRLKVATGFMDRPLEQAEKALQNGLFNVSAICDGKVIGMGRLVGDGAMYWYLSPRIQSFPPFRSPRGFPHRSGHDDTAPAQSLPAARRSR